MKNRYLSCLASMGLAALVGCAQPPRLLYEAPLEINPSVRKGLQEYERLPLQKAFAGASDGAYGFGFLGDEPNRAIRTALSNCQKRSARPCRLMDISGIDHQPAYPRFAMASQKALTGMKLPRLSSYHFESLDWKINAPTRLRTRAEGYHGPTPMALPGIQTVTTAELAAQLKSGRVTLIDTRGWTDEPLQTLPNAYFIDWSGAEDGEAGGREVALRNNFARVMQLIQPDKTQPVSVFCVSAECWLSVNAALRLQSMGYTNVSWYRGGIESWLAAQLPLVTAVPHATVWSE